SLAERYGIMSIPTMLVFKNGKVSAKSVGAIPKESVIALLSK
ncbi:MAG TPA: thioredoxin domain-containing protein, partial [Bacillota bacterium]|nr:thioredoxin domain-containing protein [Bacillota bacterium]